MASWWSSWRQGRQSTRQPLQRGVDLLGSQPTRFAPPRQLGLNLAPAGPAWSSQHLELILKQLGEQPSAELMLEARYGRHCLSRFWLEAPVDQLSGLWQGDLGRLSRLLIHSPLPGQPLSRDEQRWRHRLLQDLASQPDLQGSGNPERTNQLLALLPYLEPGQQLPLAASALPSWLMELSQRCQNQAKAQPRALLTAASEAPQANTNQPQEEAPPITRLPRLIETDGQTLLEQLSQDSSLKRGTGLLRLLEIDPDDAEVLEELQALRLAMAQLLLDVAPSDLETLYRSAIGDLYRSLVQQALPLGPGDEAHQQSLMQLLLEEHTGRDDGLLLAVVLFIPPARISLDPSGFELPDWINGAWRELSGETPAR